MGSASNEQIGLWVVILLLILRGLVDFKNLLAKPKTEAMSAPIPTPVVVQETPRFAEAKGVQNLADRVGSMDRDLRQLKDELSAQGEARAVAIHARLEPLVQTVAALQGKIESIQTTLSTIMRHLTKRDHA